MNDSQKIKLSAIGIHKMTMTSSAITLYHQCRRHLVGQRVESNI